MPLLLILIIFVLAPLAELYLLIEVGRQIGALSTIGFSLLTAFLGGALVRFQGLRTLLRVQQSMAQGQLPALELIEGAILLVCGLLLLLPGFVTDGIGFLLLIPPLRRLAALRLARGMLRPMAGATRDENRVIEGEFKSVDPSDPRLPRDQDAGSRWDRD